jgi:hypothetical protein
MALKDIGKIVANQTAKEKALESQPQTNKLTEAGKSWLASLDEKAANIKPFTNKPADVTGHRGFKYDSTNPFHKDIVSTLLNNGQADKITVHEGGTVSFPAETVYEHAAKFQVAAETAGGEKRFKGEAAKVAPRKRTSTAAPSTRPAAANTRPPARLPKPGTVAKKAEANPLIEDRAEVMRNLFGK